MNGKQYEACYAFAMNHHPVEWAKKFGYTTGYAKVWYCNNSISFARSKYGHIPPAEKFIAFVKDHTVNETCDEFSISRSTIYRYCKKLNVKCKEGRHGIQ